MPGSLIGVSEAAVLLGVGPMAVRRQIAAGSLSAERVGREWLIDRDEVERLNRLRPGRGRPLSAAVAWTILLLASDAPDAAGMVAGGPMHFSRARAWLRVHSLVEDAARLRLRARSERFAAHPSELPRLLRRNDVLVSGVSAADRVGVLDGSDDIEFYAPQGHRQELIDDHALLAEDGGVLVRWTPDSLWASLAEGRDGQAPSAAVYVDLLEHDDPRLRREAARALSA